MAQLPPMDSEKIQAALQTSQAQALLRLIQNSKDPTVAQALAAAKAGDYRRAVTLLQPYLAADGSAGREGPQRG